MDIEKSPDNTISQETSAPNEVVPESRPEEKPKKQEMERARPSKTRVLAAVHEEMKRMGNQNPSVRGALEFLRARVDEAKIDISKLEERQRFQDKTFKGVAVPSLWGNTETIDSLKEQVRSDGELLEYLGIINDQDRKLEDVVREWKVPMDELLDVIDEVKERIRSQVGGGSLGRAESLLSWQTRKYDQVAEILGRYASELNTSGLSISKIEELIEGNKSELEKAGLTKIAGEIIEALRKRAS